MLKRLIPMVAALPLIAACASTEPVRAPRTDLPAAYTQAQLDAAAAPLERWWVAFDDPQLTALIEEALRSAPDAELALARLEEARATRLANIRSAFPTGDLLGNYTRRETEQVSGGQSVFQNDGVTTTESLGFDVSWEVDIWGKTRASRRAVEADFASKVFNIESARASLAANVADSLFAARGLLQQLADAQENVRIAQSIQDLADLRAERGLIAEADARRTRADVAQAGAAVLQIEAELTAARRSLLVLLGRGTDRLESLPITLEDRLPPAAPAAVPGNLLERRPDVREAENRLLVAIALMEVDRKELFPRFTILPGLGLTRTESESFTGFDNQGAPTFGPVSTTIFDWTIGAGVSVPVLSRPRLLAEARASDAQADQALIAYEVAVQTAYAEADSALVQLAADRNRLALLATGEADARAAYDAAKLRYDAGLEDMTTLLSAETAWRNARASATAARTQAMRRAVQVFKALGGGWAPGDDFEV